MTTVGKGGHILPLHMNTDCHAEITMRLGRLRGNYNVIRPAQEKIWSKYDVWILRHSSQGGC